MKQTEQPFQNIHSTNHPSFRDSREKEASTARARTAVASRKIEKRTHPLLSRMHVLHIPKGCIACTVKARSGQVCLFGAGIGIATQGLLSSLPVSLLAYCYHSIEETGRAADNLGSLGFLESENSRDRLPI
jgi:hypothetical protein